MVGELKQVSDYSTKQHRMQTTYQNTHFSRRFGRNDFKEIDKNDVVQSVRYLLKYIEKSGERLVYGGDLPTYFKSDVMDEDIACHTGIDDRKALLFDDFNCWERGLPYRQSKSRNHLAVAEMQLNHFVFRLAERKRNRPFMARVKCIAFRNPCIKGECDIRNKLYNAFPFVRPLSKDKKTFSKEIKNYENRSYLLPLFLG